MLPDTAAKLRCVSLLQVLAGFALAMVAMPHHRAMAMEDLVEIKALNLNPAPYLKRDVRIRGHVRAAGAGESWYVLEDGTGRILVTTVALGIRTHCVPGSRAIVRGRLRSLGSEYGLYFALSDVEGCSNHSHPWAARVSRLLNVGFSWIGTGNQDMVDP